MTLFIPSVCYASDDFHSALLRLAARIQRGVQRRSARRRRIGVAPPDSETHAEIVITTRMLIRTLYSILHHRIFNTSYRTYVVPRVGWDWPYR